MKIFGQLKVFGSPFGMPSGGTSTPAQIFTNKLINVYGASEVWRLTDIETGTVIPASVNSARNGTHQGWTLQNGTSPVTGDTLKPPLSDGSNDYGNILNASHISIINGVKGSVLAFAQVSGAGVWTDTVSRDIFRIATTTNDRIVLGKSSANNIMIAQVREGASNKTLLYTVTSPPTAVTMWGMSWNFDNPDVGENFIRINRNGSEVGTPVALAGTFGGTPNIALIGASATTPTAVWDGWLSYVAVKYGSIWSAADFAAIYADAVA